MVNIEDGIFEDYYKSIRFIAPVQLTAPCCNSFST